MKSIILNFEGEPVEIPFGISDYLLFSTPETEVIHNGDYYVTTAVRTVSGLDEYTQERSAWDGKSEIRHDMSLIINLKKK